MASVTRVLPHHHISLGMTTTRSDLSIVIVHTVYLRILATACSRSSSGLFSKQWPPPVSGIPQDCRITQLESFDRAAARGQQGERKWRGHLWFQKTGEVSTWQAVSSDQLPLRCVRAPNTCSCASATPGCQPPAS